MLTFTIAATLLMALAIAGWPVLLLRRLRPALQLTGGSCCVVAGSTIMGLLAAGLIALPGSESAQAAAQEKATDSATSAEPAGGSQSAAASADVTPAQPATAGASASAKSAPEIKIASSATTPEDLKIETKSDGTIVIPAGRPEWVKTGKSDFSDPKVHKIYVTSDPYKEPHDAQRALDEALKRKTDEYIGDQLHSPLAAKFIPYDAQTIRDRFVKQTYRETITFDDPIGPMQQLHAQLEFDEAFRNEISHHWAGRIAESRLYQVGLIAGASLLLLGSVFSYFRLDNATRGYYTGRLQFMTAAAILAVVAFGAVAAFHFTWL